MRWSLLSSAILVALIALAGCSHYMMAEREPWRRDAESACLDSGAVKESPSRVRISSIDGPGACGISYPLKVSSLGDGGPLGYEDDSLVPPGSIPNAGPPNSSMPQHWPIAQPSSVQSNPLPPPQSTQSPYSAAPAQHYNPPQAYPPPQTYSPPQRTYGQSPAAQAQYGQPQYGAPQPGAPLSIRGPGIPEPVEDDVDSPGAPSYPPNYSARPPADPIPPLGPSRDPVLTSAGPVELKPAATLACPIVSALDQWLNNAVQPAAQRWFRQPVVEIKQISAYSCRGMNGDPNAHISEHAFGNALDVAEFTLADGHKVSVQYGWHGTPEEQAFLHDVQSAACEQFTTVLAPGANVYHYNHIHVDLMRHYNSRHICEPSAISGQVAFERARAQYAAKHGDPGITGALGTKIRHILGYADDDKRPDAVPGDD
ncbi:MAG: extensin family protein [Xanthobacteraceae bacterium]